MPKKRKGDIYGKRNTGSDTRVKAIETQLYHLFGYENIEIGVLNFNRKLIDVYYEPPTILIEISTIFFWPLLKICCEYHLVVLSEGACLKSKLSNSLLAFFIQAVGIMKRQSKPSIAYGSESGYMDADIYNLVKNICNKTFFIARTQPSLDNIKKMNLKGTLGTDTAWSFLPGHDEWAHKELENKLNWDGKRPIIGISVINPFWWPVQPSIRKWIYFEKIRNPHTHYEKFYFHSDSQERRKLFNNYLTSLANAVNKFLRSHDMIPVIFGMEALDYHACQCFQRLLNTPTVIFSSQVYNGFQMVSILRKISLLITSRYHANVLSMPFGVPTIGLSMDERIYNLMAERNHHQYYYIDCEDAYLEDKLFIAMEDIWMKRATVKNEILAIIPKYLRLMANMGFHFQMFIRENFPDFPFIENQRDWVEYLPPLDVNLNKLIQNERLLTGGTTGN